MSGEIFSTYIYIFAATLGMEKNSLKYTGLLAFIVWGALLLMHLLPSITMGGRVLRRVDILGDVRRPSKPVSEPDSDRMETFVLISPEELRVPDYIVKDVLEANGIPYQETRSLEESMSELDILYMTRVQKERFFNEEDYLRLKDSYVLTPEKLVSAKADLSILHPLPRVNEITVAVDKDPRAAYWRQVKNGKYIRMALIMKLLGIQV